MADLLQFDPALRELLLRRTGDPSGEALEGAAAREMVPVVARLADPSLLPALRGCSGYALEVVDLDGDGRGELVGSFAGEEGSDALIRRTMTSGSYADRQCPGEGALAAGALP